MRTLCLKAADRQGLAALVRAGSQLLRLASTASPYLSALLRRLHLFLYVLDCEILYLCLHLKLFQSGWWLSQWLFSSVHLEEDILLLTAIINLA